MTKILLDIQAIAVEELEKVLSIQRKTNKQISQILIEEGLLAEEEIIAIVSYYSFIPFIDLSKFEIEHKTVRVFPENLARKYNIFPMYRIGNNLIIAIADPLDVITLDNLRLSLGCEITQVLSKEKMISDFLNNYYLEPQVTLTQILDRDNDKETEEETADSVEVDSMDLIKESQKQPIIQAVEFIVNEAIVRRASDIHIEPQEEDLSIRYRVDGILHEIHSLPKKIQKGIAARIKILSGLDITRFYIPQDGRFHMKTQGKDIDFRVSTLPTIFGEKFVLRILDKANVLVKLSELGFSPQPLSLVNEAIAKNHGMMLITGPTGSGKSTTLYAMLAELNTVQRHIITVEDPVEYQIDGISQVQIRHEIDLTFAAALRGILRQTPDTIMVGEIRDTETADIAIKASLIGQLILSTLHTNDAIGAFARLIDMGIERYLVASSLILVCAQRLCRRICSNCKEPLGVIPKDLIRILNLDIHSNLRFYTGKGCKKCSNTGYKGRVALLEALKVDEAIKTMIIKQAPFNEIKQWAINEKRLVTLRNDGLTKASEGITTLEEVGRITARD